LSSIARRWRMNEEMEDFVYKISCCFDAVMKNKVKFNQR